MGTKCPIYSVGTSGKTQVAKRDDGVWFMRQRGLRGLWGAWEEQRTRPYEFSAWLDRRAGNARLPNAS